jgi:TerC family integral membrane protein
MGAFLVFTGVKIMFTQDSGKNLKDTMIMRLTHKLFRVTHELKNEYFFIRKNKLLYATPLLVALIVIEFSDLVFAIDSIPAVFAITRDPFIVWSSNIFAILGLRAMYFLLARMVEELALLKYGIALILVLVGVKMIIEPWVSVPVGISLGTIIFIILVFSFMSVSVVQRRSKT